MINLLILFLVIVVLITTFSRPDMAVYALGGSAVIFMLSEMSKRDPEYNEKDDTDDDVDGESYDDENIEREEFAGEADPNPEYIERSMDNNPHDTFVSWKPGASDSMSEKNRHAIDQVYGNKMNSVDNGATKHKMRIGDRDRKAIIAQVKGRRNNTYEPYYRQELSEHGSKRWWEPDDVLMRILPDRQLNTIPIGRHTEENSRRNMQQYNTMGVNW